jgi:hypothetical protein
VATITGLTSARTLELLAQKIAHGELVISVGNTDDLLSELSTAPPGSTIYLIPGVTFEPDQPLIIPPQVTLLGNHGGHLDDVTMSVISPTADFSGAAVILFVDQATGGYSQLSAEQRIEKVSIDCSRLTGSTIDGIQSQGLVHGVYLEDVQVKNPPNHGLGTVSNSSGVAYSWRSTRLHVSNPGGIGITASMTDATWIDCEAIGAVTYGWYTGGGANSVFIGCRAEWSTLDGFEFGSGSGTGQGSGGPTFIGCSTDRNGHNGVSFPSGANGNAPVTFIGCTFRRDGKASTSAGYAGININGSTEPITITGCQIYPGTDDDGTGNASPQYGISVTGATSVSIGGVHAHAISEGIHDGGSNTRFARGLNITERTGTTSSPTTVARGLQAYGTNGGSLHVPEHLAGIPTPREHNLAAWTYPMEHIQSGKAGVAGTLYLSSLSIPRPVAITKLAWGINTAGSGVVSGQNFIGVYAADGTRVARLGVDARVTTTGGWEDTISSLGLVPGDYWFAYLFNATTMPQIYRAGDLSASIMNLGLTTSTLRFATNGTGLTDLPTSLTLASNVAAQFSYFGAFAE